MPGIAPAAETADWRGNAGFDVGPGSHFMPGIAPAVGIVSCSFLRAGCGRLGLDVPLRNGFTRGPPLAAQAVPQGVNTGEPSRTSVSPAWWCSGRCPEQLEVVFACCPEAFWSGSGNLRPDLAAGSGFVSGLFPAAWNAFCVQPLWLLWRIAMSPVWWLAVSCFQLLGLPCVCCHGALGAAQMHPDGQENVGGSSPVRSPAHRSDC